MTQFLHDLIYAACLIFGWELSGKLGEWLKDRKLDPLHRFDPMTTPQGFPVIATFVLRDRAYSVDWYGNLYLVTPDETDDPNNWIWQEATKL